MFLSQDVIHIEPTTRCTLECHQCPRTQFIDNVNILDCDIESTVNFCKNFKTVIMCGNHGDPIYHKDFHTLVKHLKENNLNLYIVTNGSFRSKRWWEKLSSLLNENDTVTFSIDGIPSNNHLYRKNSKWSSIENGIRELRKNNKLNLHWKYIYFKYNQSDVDYAIDLSKQLGFNTFTLVKSSRYDSNDNIYTPTVDYNDIIKELNDKYNLS